MPPHDPRSDSELVAAVNAGDDDAFEALYHRYRDWVYRLAYRFTRNEADALDVLQETFAYLVGKFPGFRLTAQLTTLLYRVVRSQAVNRRRKRRPAEWTEAAFDLAVAPDRPDGPSSQADLAAVFRILPPAQREVLLMRFVDGLALAEIAEALAVPLGTVKSRMHHALATLRKDERTLRYFET